VNKINGYKVSSDDWVKVTVTGNIIELMYMEHKSKGNNIKKISADQYVDMLTGEVKDYTHTTNRAQSKNEFAKSFKKLRDLVNCNTVEPYKCRWVTVTYDPKKVDNVEILKDPNNLYKNMKNFIGRLRRAYGKFECLQVPEPHASGIWHVHIIMIFPGRAPFIDNKIMAKIWGHGTTDTQKVDDNVNIGAYLSAYLGDVALDEFETSFNELPNNKKVEVLENMYQLEVKEVNGKKYIKGGRLHMYPSGMNLYRPSRGIKRPVVERMKEKKAQKKVSSAKLTYEKTIELKEESTGFENTINYRYYNLKRK